jgi:hypothetical protein
MDDNTYVFEKVFYDIHEQNKDRTSVNVLIATNVFSYILGKFLVHIF